MDLNPHSLTRIFKLKEFLGTCTGICLIYRIDFEYLYRNDWLDLASFFSELAPGLQQGFESRNLGVVHGNEAAEDLTWRRGVEGSQACTRRTVDLVAVWAPPPHPTPTTKKKKKRAQAAGLCSSSCNLLSGCRLPNKRHSRATAKSVVLFVLHHARQRSLENHALQTWLSASHH